MLCTHKILEPIITHSKWVTRVHDCHIHHTMCRWTAGNLHTFYSCIVIPFGFEQSPYTFEEADLLVDTVFVTKGDVVSEQNHTVLVQFSSNNFAEPGKCI